jgi:hypothetical protein
MALKLKYKLKDEIPPAHLPFYTDRAATWLPDVDGPNKKSKFEKTGTRKRRRRKKAMSPVCTPSGFYLISPVQRLNCDMKLSFRYRRLTGATLSALGRRQRMRLRRLPGKSRMRAG